jgi:hypothetical protein
VGLALGDRLAVLKAVAALRTEGVPWTTGMADAFAFALAVAESPDGKWVQDASMVLTSLSSARLGGYRDAVTRMVALATRDVAGHERLCGALTAQRVTKPDHLLFAMLPVPTMCP